MKFLKANSITIKLGNSAPADPLPVDVLIKSLPASKDKYDNL
jgi:hypothetical protein